MYHSTVVVFYMGTDDISCGSSVIGGIMHIVDLVMDQSAVNNASLL